MAAETITVYVDPQQVAMQKANNYSLFLAKMVNGQFTVLWQALGPFATAQGPAYEDRNTFQIGMPSFQVNYGVVNDQGGWIAFNAAGMAQGISLGQAVTLEPTGIFDPPTNSDAAGQITIFNQLQGNPYAALLDNLGNPIFVNTMSGMDIGATTLTPIDTYQLWFGNSQNVGTIIANTVSNPGTVTFDGGEANQVISYNPQGQWQSGPLAMQAQVADQAASGPAL